ncbi:glycoside hydrolase family 76 protein [Atractiella rhizophila]|nr:glycoside hydrolase family 76 protein [Atractiella rhizophila]
MLSHLAAILLASTVGIASAFPLVTYDDDILHSLDKRQCAATLSFANNLLENLHNLMLGAGNDDFSGVADESYIGRAVNLVITDWNSYIGGSYDDAQWLILACWKIADYKYARGQDGSNYITAAQKIYDIIETKWDTSTCGGGVWWSSAEDYKNAVTNELFLYISAKGYLRGFGQKYLDNAIKEWNWLSASGMRNSDGLYNDGLTSDCKNNGQTTWIYNQGVVASGLAALASATNNPSLLDQAEITLDATISHLTQNGILKESCDNAASSTGACNNDQKCFKGIWMKHLQYYLDEANDPARTAKYSGFIGAQESAIVHYGTGAANICGSVWYAPDQGGSQFTVQTANAGIEGSVAAAKYGPC